MAPETKTASSSSTPSSPKQKPCFKRQRLKLPPNDDEKTYKVWGDPAQATGEQQVKNTFHTSTPIDTRYWKKATP